MLIKSRRKNAELLILKSLNLRMNLSEKDKQHFFNLRKGYEGEVLFDSLIEKLSSECFILNDLLLKFNNTVFQIDSLIIFSESIYLFEVKNYEGDYYYEADRLYKRPNFEVTNPLNQLGRSETLFRQLLLNLGYNIPIDPSVVFINPQFTLYQAPLNKPFIFPTQIDSYLKKLGITAKLTVRHKALADKLMSLHMEESPYKLLPAYDYDQLLKGITCAKCNSFSISIKRKKWWKCVCGECEHVELVATAVMRSVKEFKLLFPNEKITTNVIYEWCKVVESKKVIRGILAGTLKKVGVNQWSYYI